MTALEADLIKAVATIVQTAKDLHSEDSQLRIEVATVHREIGIERQITRELVEAVDRRMDAQERKLERLVVAIEKLAGVPARG